MGPSLEALIASDPQCLLAQSQPYCAGPDLSQWTRADVERLRPKNPLRADLLNHLNTPTDTLRVLTYTTSTRTPEPLVGFGDLYAFFFHPTRETFLGCHVSEWTS